MTSLPFPLPLGGLLSVPESSVGIWDPLTLPLVLPPETLTPALMLMLLLALVLVLVELEECECREGGALDWLLLMAATDKAGL